ncbi:MAG TPA: type II CAAX endopeptidase family protein [Croceibacterium sp.]
MTNWILLVATLAVLAVWNARETRRYAMFKQTDDPAERMAFYRRWLVTSFALLGLGSLAILAVLGRLGAIATLPGEFAALYPRSGPTPPVTQMDGSLLAGFAIGATISLSVLAFVWHRRLRKMTQPVIGDIEPLLPRNRRETWMAVPLSLNAGISEELCFRLALPLLITASTGSAIAGLALAAVIFGLMHRYQGWKGIAMTTLVGAFFTWVYIASGSLVKPMVLHVLVDLIALVVRPAVSRLVMRRTARAALAHA